MTRVGSQRHGKKNLAYLMVVPLRLKRSSSRNHIDIINIIFLH